MKTTTSSTWTSQRERGSSRLIRLMVWLSLTAGWRLGAVLLYPITLYFFLAASQARGASRDYLARVLGRPAGAADVFRHLLNFAAVILDRVFLLSRRDRGYDITVEGLDRLVAHLQRGGCVLMGAHFGSFDVLRVVGRQAPVPVRPLMYRQHGGGLTALLEALDPALAAAIIDIGQPDTMLRVQEAVAQGEMIGILADRSPGDTRQVTVPFLGSPAAFPAGPWILASVLEVPVVIFYGVRTGSRRYLVRFEAFSDRLVLNRGTREDDLRAAVGRYAASLEGMCRSWPYNWFNFYQFWSAPPHASSQNEK
ncbi:MAG: acyltransferase [Acetobacteraceae bacterium]